MYGELVPSGSLVGHRTHVCCSLSYSSGVLTLQKMRGENPARANSALLIVRCGQREKNRPTWVCPDSRQARTLRSARLRSTAQSGYRRWSEGGGSVAKARLANSLLAEVAKKPHLHQGHITAQKQTKLCARPFAARYRYRPAGPGLESHLRKPELAVSANLSGGPMIDTEAHTTRNKRIWRSTILSRPTGKLSLVDSHAPAGSSREDETRDLAETPRASSRRISV